MTGLLTCLWFEGEAEAAANFYAATFPGSSVEAVNRAPGDNPGGGKTGDVLTVEFTVFGHRCIGLNGGPMFKHSEAFSFMVLTGDQDETDRYWNAIVGNGGSENACGWCKDRWGISWQITPRVLLECTTSADKPAAKRAYEAMMTMRKIDIAAIERAFKGEGMMAERILELSIERLLDAPAAAVWEAWEQHLAEWWCPKPWRTEIVEIDLRPGGRASMIMHGPDGEEHPQDGVILEVVPGRKVVFTDAFLKNWIPNGPFFVGIMEFTPEGDKTRYRGTVRHWTEEALKQHEAMGFEAGWGAVAAQLEEVAKRLA